LDGSAPGRRECKTGEKVMKRASGFTLIELLIVVAIVAILAAVAVPAYTKYVQRGDVVEATQALSQYRVAMEQFYQDNGNYGAAACGAVIPTTLIYFKITCALNGNQAYVATATANNPGPVAGFTYTINQLNAQATTSIPAAWGALASYANAGTSWIVK
jgi:type IV pilus assembly protein PilE